MNKKILVIDDENTVRDAFPRALEDTSFKVETAESGRLGLAKLKNKSYDLVYLDLKMPDMNGVETFREIRKIDKNVQIYFITAFHKEYLNELKSISSEGHDFELAKKPLEMDQILSITQSILAS